MNSFMTKPIKTLEDLALRKAVLRKQLAVSKENLQEALQSSFQELPHFMTEKAFSNSSTITQLASSGINYLMGTSNKKKGLATSNSLVSLLLSKAWDLGLNMAQERILRWVMRRFKR